MTTDLSAFCTSLGIGEKGQKKLAPHWETLLRNTEEGVPFFLKRDFYEPYISGCKIPEECLKQMHLVSDFAEKEPCAARYAAMLHYAVYQANPEISVADFPVLEVKLRDRAGLFPLLVAISAIPMIRKAHAQLHLPEHFLTDGIGWIGEAMSIYRAANKGKPGFLFSQLYWLRLQAEKRLFRIGRFEYLMHPWPEMFPVVYRCRKTGMLKAFCREGWQFDRRGFRMEGLPEEKPAYVTHLTVRDGGIRGTEIRRDGTADCGNESILDESDWEPFCSSGDVIPSIHIPGGGGMTMEKLKQSLIDAKAFFRRYFHTDVKAFVCDSWILNPAWRKLLPDSNLAAFQRIGYSCPPIRSGYRHGLYFVYGDAHCDPRTQPLRTSLHKAFCRMVEEGIPFALGNLFLPSDEIEQIEINK